MWEGFVYIVYNQKLLALVWPQQIWEPLLENFAVC